MSNKLVLNTFRTIKQMFRRFISLIIICFLGALTFFGLHTASSSMMISLDEYLDTTNTYDIKIMSTYGLTDNDIKEIKKIEGIKDVEGNKSVDTLVEINSQDYVLNISTLPENVNNLTLKSGRLPKVETEIVVEENLLVKNNLKIGNQLSVNDTDLNNQYYTIVGVVESPLFYNATRIVQNRGITNVGTGNINYYSFTINDSFNMNYYTSIYVTVENAKDKMTSDDSYKNIVNSLINKLETIKDKQEEIRLLEVKDEFELTKLGYKMILNQYQLKYIELKNEFNSQLKILNISEDQLESKIENLNNTKQELEIIISNTDESDENYIIYLEQLNKINTELNRYLEVDEKRKDALLAEDKLSYYTGTYNKIIMEFEDRLANVESKWYLFDRTQYITYNEYIDDCNSITNLAKVFPLLFFLITILISSVSMNRLVEEDRQEIGTLKSLGYDKTQIMTKYLLFALFTVLIGGVLGCLIGGFILPKIIFSLYSLLFALPKFYIHFEIKYLLICLLLLLVCIIGTTIITVEKVVRKKTSELLRPKAPNKGKRVFLERFSGLWTKLNFSKKITIRNLFRYKKRSIITVIGVAGCCALLMCGFGFKDSIINISERQFNNVFTFDAMIYVNDYQKEDELIFNDERIKNTTNIQLINTQIDNRKVAVYIVEDNKNIENAINFNDYKTYERKELENNKIIVTQKFAEFERIDVGEYLEFNINDREMKLEVSAIVENYMDHYIFMNEATYSQLGSTFTPNVVCVQTVELSSDGEKQLAEDLLKEEKIINISYVSDIQKKVDDLIHLLDNVVAILIILSSLLSFVVLYNLSSINIQERKRELSTFKVLGFYNKEVDYYITRENIILTLVGIIFGTIGGYFLTRLFIDVVEIEKAYFIRDVRINSYIYSILLTVLFTYIINLISHFNIKKIDMIESLKSIE